MIRLIFAEQLNAVFNKADDDHDGRTGEPGEKHDFKNLYGESR